VVISIDLDSRVMEWTIPLVERANAFIGYSHVRL
jgi:hypothetical protein